MIKIPDRFWRNTISRRYIVAVSLPDGEGVAVYDQRDRRFLPEEEWDTVKADELMRI